jgi:hypothetical protein
LKSPESSLIGMKNLLTKTLNATKLPTVKAPSGSREGLTSLRIKKPAVKINREVAVVRN